jgi:YbbR domain-containing protein
MQTEQIKPVTITKKRRRIFTFIFFIFLSSLFWLLIKLSNNYTVPFDFTISIIDVPVDKWITGNNNHKIRAIVTTSGFNLLKDNYLKTNKRNLNISLLTVPYRKLAKNNHYISTQNFIDQIASNLGVPENAIHLDETEITFELVGQLSVDVPVIVRTNISYRQQFNQYGPILVDPEFVKVFGPASVLDTLKGIFTEEIKLNNVDYSFAEKIKLDINQSIIAAELQEVDVKISVEKFTESSLEMQIIKPAYSNIKLFPEKVMVYYLVAMKDFEQINPNSFTIFADTTGLQTKERYLPLKLMNVPSNIKISRIEPNQIEYLIVD